VSKGTLTILQLYPNEMNIYGDYGNLLTLQRRAEWHGYQVEIAYHHPGKVLPVNADIIIGGGGQDSGQDVVGSDLLRNAELLRGMVDDGTPMLMICGMYQLFGHRFVTSEDHTIKGIGIFDIETFAGPKRLIGNIVTRSDIFGEIIGYENHSGLTHLLNEQKPFGRVVKGAGNNGQDNTEGVIVHNAIGTYMHGSLLPKNPSVADHLLETAIMRKYGDFDPEIIDDTFANRARVVAKKRPR
jgi:CobQ-like glutamine amidotransferase family enzyme